MADVRVAKCYCYCCCCCWRRLGLLYSIVDGDDAVMISDDRSRYSRCWASFPHPATLAPPAVRRLY